MDEKTLAMVLGLGGGLLGLLGGAAGTRASLHAARPGAERRLMARWAAGFWAGLAAVVAAHFLTPPPARPTVGMVSVLAMIWAIRCCNEGLTRIRSAGADRPA